MSGKEPRDVLDILTNDKLSSFFQSSLALRPQQSSIICLFINEQKQHEVLVYIHQATELSLKFVSLCLNISCEFDRRMQFLFKSVRCSLCFLFFFVLCVCV